MFNVPKPILVTGSHRSGSTWIGKVISASPALRYIHEPFNIDKKTINPPLNFWFEYINNQTEVAHQKEVSAYLKSYYKTGLNLNPPVSNPYQWCKQVRSRMLRHTLIKDPIALFSAAWIYEQIGCHVIISIRHPAAFVASLKVKGWNFPFDHFIGQPFLMHDLLHPFRNSIEDILKDPDDIVKEGILLWNCLYSAVLQYQKKYKGKWYFVRHEDLSYDSEVGFREIFTYLDLTITKEVLTTIAQTTSGNSFSGLDRDSKKNIKSWQQRLSDHEIERIKEGTKQIWTYFYTQEDWI